MTKCRLDWVMAFHGKVEDFDTYCKLMDKRQRLYNRLRRICNEIDDEECSLSVFKGKLTERDKSLKARHEEAKELLIEQREQVTVQIETISKSINKIITIKGD